MNPNDYKLKMMMKNYCALSDTTVAANSVPFGDWDIDHIMTATPDAEFRTTDETTVQITLTLAQFRTVSAYGLFGHNLSQSAIITTTIKRDNQTVYTSTGFANDPINTPFYRSPFATRPFGYSDGDELDVVLNHTAVFFPPNFCDEVVIDIQDNDNADGYIRIGYLYIGETIEPRFNPPFGDGIGSTVNLTATHNDGILYSKYQNTGRTAQVSLPWLTELEAIQIEQGIKFCIQNNLPVFVSYYEGAGGILQSDHELLAKVEGYEPPSQHAHGYFGTALRLIESVM